jgi:hypothetical protein
VTLGQANSDIVSESILRLDTYFKDMSKMYGPEGVDKVAVTTLGNPPTPGIEAAGGKRYESLEQHLASLRGIVNGRPADAS